jgi:hypothetical protein
MKNRIVQRVTLCFCVCILSPFIMGMGQSGASRGSGGDHFGGPFLLVLLLIILIVPVVKAYNAAKQAEKFKTLVFILTFYEWLGWILCFTIIGIPIGLGFVLASQLSRVFIQIEANTHQTLKIMQSHKEHQG